MPDLDMSDVLVDSDFADTVNVIRRTETINSHGRSEVVEEVVPNVVAVITHASPDDLVRYEASQMTGNSIVCITPFFLRASSIGVQPDIVEWDGMRYTVVAIDRYNRYGSGFIESLCTSMNADDHPPGE